MLSGSFEILSTRVKCIILEFKCPLSSFKGNVTLLMFYWKTVEDAVLKIMRIESDSEEIDLSSVGKYFRK